MPKQTKAELHSLEQPDSDESHNTSTLPLSDMSGSAKTARNEPVIGIDLGTTFSVVACYRNDKVEIIPDKYGDHLVPSMVFYDSLNGEIAVGRLAFEKAPLNPKNHLMDAKRLLGRHIEDQSIKKWYNTSETQFSLGQTAEGMAAYSVEVQGQNQIKKPEEISAEVLKYLKICASEYLGQDVVTAVISVPAYFSNAQRKATKRAAELAGLMDIKLITEPVAGAIHYVADKEITAKLLVFDFGGGTLDVSLIEVNDLTFEVKAVSGDTMLGGRNIDKIIMNYFNSTTRNEQNGRNILRKLRRLEEECISLKENLTVTTSFTKILDCFEDDHDFTMSLDQETFNRINSEIFQRAINIVEYLLRNANCNKSEIDRVVLVGGSTRIPKIREMLTGIFGSEKISTDLNPDVAVAGGAAIFAATLREHSIKLEKYKVSEVTPLSLGLELSGVLMGFAIKCNTKLPAVGTIDVCTTQNNQRTARFKILEGERKLTIYNNEIGEFEIQNLPPRPAGDVTFKVIFNLDEDGILMVDATEKSTGKSNKLVVTMGEFRLSEQEINYQFEEANKQKSEEDLIELIVRLFN